MVTIVKRATMLLGAFACIALLSACGRNPVPPDGTSVTSSSPAFARLAQDIQGDCERMGGCTCIMDGVQTTCSIVFSCLDAGFCVLVATD